MKKLFTTIVILGLLSTPTVTAQEDTNPYPPGWVVVDIVDPDINCTKAGKIWTCMVDDTHDEHQRRQQDIDVVQFVDRKSWMKQGNHVRWLYSHESTIDGQPITGTQSRIYNDALTYVVVHAPELGYRISGSTWSNKASSGSI